LVYDLLQTKIYYPSWSADVSCHGDGVVGVRGVVGVVGIKKKGDPTGSTMMVMMVRGHIWSRVSCSCLRPCCHRCGVRLRSC
ncbi:hypothetical protein Tco_1567989, partial [Tanacetum coccineum]